MAQRTATCLDCGETFEAKSRGRVAERCPPHRALRWRQKTDESQARRRPCRHPEGCERPSNNDGWCAMHAYRLKRYGSPGTAEPKRPRDRYENNGYTMIRVGGALRYEHRIVMEQILGRPLEKYENVHHVNGARNDNRPENLEVWLTSQPAGQRPADVIDWFLDFYPDLVAERQEARNATLK